MPIDMSLTDEEKRSLATPSIGKDIPKFPSGLRIHLTAEEMNKLPLMKNPEVDQEFMMIAKVKVVQVSLDGDEKPSMSLQIVEMDLKKDKEESESNDSVQVIYGS